MQQSPGHSPLVATHTAAASAAPKTAPEPLDPVAVMHARQRSEASATSESIFYARGTGSEDEEDDEDDGELDDLIMGVDAEISIAKTTKVPPRTTPSAVSVRSHTNSITSQSSYALSEPHALTTDQRSTIRSPASPPPMSPQSVTRRAPIPFSPSVSARQSIASLASMTSGPIRRKPLASTASPALVARFSGPPRSRKSMASVAASIDTLMLENDEAKDWDRFPLPPGALEKVGRERERSEAEEERERNLRFQRTEEEAREEEERRTREAARASLESHRSYPIPASPTLPPEEAYPQTVRNTSVSAAASAPAPQSPVYAPIATQNSWDFTNQHPDTDPDDNNLDQSDDEDSFYYDNIDPPRQQKTIQGSPLAAEFNQDDEPAPPKTHRAKLSVASSSSTFQNQQSASRRFVYESDESEEEGDSNISYNGLNSFKDPPKSLASLQASLADEPFIPIHPLSAGFQFETIDEVTEPETSPNHRQSFQSSVYSLLGRNAEDQQDEDTQYREQDSILETPLSKKTALTTRPPSACSVSSAASSVPTVPDKSTVNLPQLNTATTATIPPYAPATNHLSSPISVVSPVSLNKPLPSAPRGFPNETDNASIHSDLPSPTASESAYGGEDMSNEYLDDPTGAYTTPRTDAVSANRALGYLENQATPAGDGARSARVDAMEDELKAITTELAASIRREMDLEDLVDRLQTEIQNPGINKRTSDYFSDSGYSTSKYGEYDASREEMEKVQRKADQEKASIRLELTTKLSEERDMRRALDEQIAELKLKATQASAEASNSAADSSRLEELENTCEDLRRRLNEERDMKTSFEDLLGALKGQLQETAQERDNLRDEVVPALRARVEGLEAQNSEMSGQVYEKSKVEQELQSLRMENETLRNLKGDEPKTRVTSLARSSSVSSQSQFRLQNAPRGLTRSNTVKGNERSLSMETKEGLMERLKDVEEQRNALHKALKNLLDRQEFQTRENEKKVRMLELERSRLISGSPRRGGYEQEIAALKMEITVLRRRAEEAVDGKWRVEDGLRGLKTDLDRAEGEITQLKALLEANDILVPPAFNPISGETDIKPVTSEDLDDALINLQVAYQQALIRIRALEAASNDGDMVTAIEKLENALSSITADRDAAKLEAAALRLEASSANSSAAAAAAAEGKLAEQVELGAVRIEELTRQATEQLAVNAALRQRLAETVAQGERARKANTALVTKLQERLRILEEQLNGAQQATEDRIARYEEEIREIRAANSTQLSRIVPLSAGLKSPGLRSPAFRSIHSESQSPRSPMFPKSPRSPRLVNSKGSEDELEKEKLRKKVAELEGALREAEGEMQNVVGKMAAAQIEVLELQEQRDEAVRDTRRVRKELEGELEKVKALAA